MEPPNPVAATMDLLARSGKGSSPFDTGLYRRQQGFMKGDQRHKATGRRPTGRMLLTAARGSRRTLTR